MKFLMGSLFFATIQSAPSSQPHAIREAIFCKLRPNLIHRYGVQLNMVLFVEHITAPLQFPPR